MTGATGFLFWLKLNEPRPSTVITEKQQQLTQIEQTTRIPEVVGEFNKINSQITSFDGSDMIVKIWENGMRLKVSGSMYYEKPLSFRMKVRSIMGEEMDMGSNNEHFWYWSRRDKHPGLYYASYADYFKTRLKTPFNPVFLRESLGLDQIDPTGAKIVEKENDVMLVWPKITATGQKVLYSVFLNKQTKRMDGIVVTDLNGKPLTSCDVEYDGVLPKRIVYDWQEEQRSLVLEFRRPAMNQSLSPNHWQMPDYTPKINMAEE